MLPNTVTGLSKVDPAVVAQLRAVPSRGSTDLYRTLVELFRAGTPGALVQLRAALADSASQPAGAICHKLRSSAANVGALAFAQELGQLERLCRQGDIPTAEAVLEGLEAAYSALMVELANS
jgi:HPt (histidine-containing phosphotransfer) domain-containing protein